MVKYYFEMDPISPFHNMRSTSALPSLHFWSGKENTLLPAGVPFWLAEQTKPTQLKAVDI